MILKKIFSILSFIIFVSVLFLLMRQPKTSHKLNSVATLSHSNNDYFFSSPRVIIGAGEYVSLGLYKDTVYQLNNVGIPTKLTGAPLCKMVVGGAHHAVMIDMNDTLWTVDDNSAGELGTGNLTGQALPFKVIRDSIGNGFGNIAGAVCGGTSFGAFWNTIVWKKNGTVWICGNTQGGALGNNTNGALTTTRFVQVPFPAGVFITKAVSGYVNIALDSAGQVWTWGAGSNNYLLGRGASPNGNSPGKITLVGGTRAIDIAGGSFWNYAILSNGHTDAWGGQFYSDYMALGPEGIPQMTTSAIDITTNLNFSSPPVQIRTNNEASYALLADSTIRAWGGNAVGTIGNGIELNYFLYGGYPLPLGTTNPFPFDWDQGNHELQQILPVNPAPGIHNFTDIFTDNALVYTVYYEDANNQIYANGRNKGGEICNGILPGNPTNGAIASIYPNSWDVPYITAISPWTLTAIGIASSPWCVLHPGTAACATYTIPNAPKPAASAGSNQNISGTTANLHGTATSSTGTVIFSNIWSLVSGPNNPIVTLNSGLSPTVTGLINGTYVFKLVVTDVNWRTDSANVTLNVGSFVPPKTTGGDVKLKYGEKAKLHNLH